jgi:hypothetical protein
MKILTMKNLVLLFTLLASTVFAGVTGLGLSSPASVAAARLVPPAVASATPNMTSDFWQKFEFDSSAGAMTTSQLGTDSGKSSSSYTITDASSIISTSSSDQVTLLSTVGGVTDTGTRGLNLLLTSGAIGKVTYAFTQTDTVTVGMFYHTSTPANFDGGPQFLFLKSVALGEDTLYISDIKDAGDNTREFLVRTNGTSYKITGISNNTTYWICVNYIRNSASSSVTVRTAAGALVGTTSITTPNSPVDIIWFGNLSVITGQSGINAYIDNIVMKFSGTSSSDYGP